jgi:hypothetical protein
MSSRCAQAEVKAKNTKIKKIKAAAWTSKLHTSHSLFFCAGGGLLNYVFFFFLTAHYHAAHAQADASLRMRSTLAGAQSASHVDTKESASVSAKVFFLCVGDHRPLSD